MAPVDENRTRGWQPLAASPQAVATLVREARLRPLTARVLVARGFGDGALVERFLNPRLADLRVPRGISDLDRALQRLVEAVAGQQKVGVFGDYDVDGVTSAAVLASGLRACQLLL